MPQPKSRLNEDAWERHKALISRRFQVEEVSLKDCIRELQELGLDVTLKQLEYRLQKWGFKRNISAKGWRYIDHQIKKRSQQGKTSRVLFCGQHVKPSRVQKETYRNRNMSTWVRSLGPPSPRTPPGLDIQVVTPPSDESNEFQYPPDMPWFMFERDSWQVLLRILPPQDSHAHVGAGSGVNNTLSLHVGFGYAGVPRSLDDPSVTADLASQVSSVVVPDGIMPRGSSSDPSWEVLKKLIFVFSNNFCHLFSRCEFSPRLRYLGRGLICLMQQSGVFENPLDFASLGWSFSAFAEKLFHYAIKYAIEKDDSQSTMVLRWMFSSGLSPDTLVPTPTHDVAYPLQYACRRGAIGVAKLLLRAGANANLVGPDCGRGVRQEPIHLLLDHWKHCWPFGEHPLGVLELGGVRDLITHGADINTDTKKYSEWKEPTPLTKAISLTDMGLMEILIDNDACLQAKRKSYPCADCGIAEYSSPLAAAAGYCGTKEHDVTAAELVEFTLRKLDGQDPNIRGEGLVDLDVILSAAEANNARVLRFLHSRGVRVDIVHERGHTALHAAAYRGALEACKFLVECGVPIGSSDGQAPSPLHLACAGGHLEVVQFLYEQVVREGNDAVVMALLQASNMWMTPLRATFDALPHSEGERCALFLLQQGISFSCRDFWHAVEHNFHDVAIAMLPKMRHPIHRDDTTIPDYSSGFERMMGCMLRYGIDPFVNGIHTALQLGNWNLVEQFLTSGVSWDTRSFGGAGNLETALLTGEQHLIGHSYDMDPSFYDGETLCAAVSGAVWSNDHTWVNRLLQNRQPGSITDKFEGGALAIAMFHKDYNLVKILHDSNPTVRVAILPELALADEDHIVSELTVRIGVLTPEHLVRNVPFWRSEEDYVEASPLAAAIARDDLDLVRHLIGLGFEVDRFGLAVAACVNSCPLLSLIAESYSDDTAPTETPVNYTPHYWAAYHQNVAMVRQLAVIDKNLNSCVDRRTLPWSSYLQMATKDNTPELIDAFLELGMDVNAPPEGLNGVTSLQLAAKAGSLPVARKLLDLGAEVNAPGSEGQGTALKLAASYARIDMIQLLLSKGARTTGRDRAQYVEAVQVALQGGNYVAANILRAHGGWTLEEERLKNHNIALVAQEDTPECVCMGPFKFLRVLEKGGILEESGVLGESDEAGESGEAGESDEVGESDEAGDSEDGEELPSSWLLTGVVEVETPQRDMGEPMGGVPSMMDTVNPAVLTLDPMVSGRDLMSEDDMDSPFSGLWNDGF